MALNKIQSLIQKIAKTDKVKKVIAAENDLQKEVTKVVAQVKKSADEVEKNFKSYKAKAQVQRQKIEKMILAKTKTSKKTAPKAKPTATKKKTTRKKAKKA